VIIASSLGQDTPFSTPEGITRRKFERLGVSEVESGAAADGTYFVGRKESNTE